MNPAIEFFRGIASLMVLLTHYGHFLTDQKNLYGFFWTGVDAFFVISGFVFAKTIYGTVSFTPYIIRRFFRIYPLYLFSLILYYFFTSGDPQKNIYFIKHLFFAQTTSSVKEAFYFNAAYWSLPIEIEFYLLVPLLSILRQKWSRILYALVLPLIAFRIIFVLNGSHTDAMNLASIMKVHLPGTMLEFLFGILVYRAFTSIKAPVRGYFAIFTLTAGLAILLALGGFFVVHGDAGVDNNTMLNLFFNMLCSLGYAMILFALLHMIKDAKSLFNSACLFLGKISYGVYLFHNLVPLILLKYKLSSNGFPQFLFCSTIVILMAIVFYYSIENPCRKLGRSLSNKYEVKYRE
jgi:exopolysaccharide production protein ExoZ